MTDVM